MQAITQRKIAEANHKTLHAIKSAGRGAADKFWTYVSRLDGKATQPEIRTESTGDKTTDLHRALTDHLHQLYAQPHPSTHTELPCPDVSEPTGTGHQKDVRLNRSAVHLRVLQPSASTCRTNVEPYMVSGVATRRQMRRCAASGAGSPRTPPTTTLV
ncbi:hypothetical protein HPB52_001070 [Rhipicephalus sanguineus]|uniref:Uncharacterized protein n=1 Tax=Rhipicephalus sanguineus TaxID=34632 RepID=A0A9D4QGR3_RHISA|nr:hypothetical protein HPB52_001070 [Rhipicephalus sanguineus]